MVPAAPIEPTAPPAPAVSAVTPDAPVAKAPRATRRRNKLVEAIGSPEVTEPAPAEQESETTIETPTEPAED
jgi:hypothetical protein